MAFDRTSLGYDFSSLSIASTSTIIFVPLNNVETKNNDVKNGLASENIDNGKSILGAPPKLDKKKITNSKVKKGNTQKLKQKKKHFYHHCGTARHTRLNCYKWLATQKSIIMICRETRISFHPLLLLLEIFSKHSCSFRTLMVLILPPHYRIKGLLNGKVLLRCGGKRALSDSITYSFSSFCIFVFALLVCCFHVLS